jgi:hypothetical protein
MQKEASGVTDVAEETGESIDTLTARKRYGLRNLSRALRQWIQE